MSKLETSTYMVQFMVPFGSKARQLWRREYKETDIEMLPCDTELAKYNPEAVAYRIINIDEPGEWILI